MPAITLQIMVNAPTHDLSYDPAKAAMRYRNGDIMDLIPTGELADLVGSAYKIRGEIRCPRFAFIHVPDFPAVGRKKAIRFITSSISAASDTLRRRKFRVKFSLLPAAKRNALRNTREITLTWAQAKQVLKRKIITVILDPTLDDESTSIRDADIA